MDDRSDIDRLIDAMYQTGLGQVGADTPIKAACDLLGFESGVALSIDQRSGMVPRTIFWARAADGPQQAEQLWRTCTVAGPRPTKDMAPGDFRFFDLPASSRGLGHESGHGVRICLEHSNERFVCIDLLPSSGKVDIQSQRRLVETLLPHWVRAHLVYMRLDHAESLQKAYRDFVNISHNAIVIFDNWGGVYIANRAAESLAPEEGISLSSTGIRATLDAENKRLQHVLRDAVARGRNLQNPASGTTMRITRSASRLPLNLAITPLLADHASFARKPAAMLIAFDPESKPAVHLAQCSELFGFTRAEAQIAVGIMQGRSIEQLALDHGRRASTTRNLLKRVFQKAGVNRQQELVSMMLNSPLLLQLGTPQQGASEAEDLPHRIAPG